MSSWYFEIYITTLPHKIFTDIKKKTYKVKLIIRNIFIIKKEASVPGINASPHSQKLQTESQTSQTAMAVAVIQEGRASVEKCKRQNAIPEDNM